MSLGCDVSKHCLSQNWFDLDGAAGAAIKQHEEAAGVCVLCLSLAFSAAVQQSAVGLMHSSHASIEMLGRITLSSNTHLVLHAIDVLSSHFYQ